MKRKKRVVFSFVLTVMLVLSLIWLRNEWNKFITSDEIRPGRDTVAFWEENYEGFVYEILRSGSDFDFAKYEMANRNNHYYTFPIKHVHFFADTLDYIILITIDNSYYSVEKRTGIISQSLVFDAIPSTEEEVSFINLLNEKQSHRSKTYRNVNPK